MRGRRLIFVNRYFYPDQSATARLLSELTFGLAAQGYAVDVVTSRQRIDEPRAGLAERETINGVNVHRVRTTVFGRGNLLLRAMDYLSFYVAAMLRLRRLVTANDIVVGFNGAGIRSANDLRNKVGLVRVGNTVTLSLLRNGRAQTIEMKVGDAPTAPKL